MGAVDDYINGLEGQESLDPLKIASELHALHNQEIGTREAKINELSGVITDKDTVISKGVTELERQKAKNFDLSMQIPGATASDAGANTDSPTGGSIKIADLFSDDVRNRHFK